MNLITPSLTVPATWDQTHVCPALSSAGPLDLNNQWLKCLILKWKKLVHSLPPEVHMGYESLKLTVCNSTVYF